MEMLGNCELNRSAMAKNRNEYQCAGDAEICSGFALMGYVTTVNGYGTV